MRVLVLNYEFPPLGGGAANATYYLLHELQQVPGIEVDLVTSSTDTMRVEEHGKNVRVHYLDIHKRGNIHFQSNADLLRYSWKAYRYSKQLVREHQFDGVHAFFGIPCGFIARRLGLPYIVSLRGSDVPMYNERFATLDRLFFKRLSRTIWKRAAAVVANSDALRDLAHTTAPEQEIGVIHNGVDTHAFAPKEATTHPITIMTSARLIERKGVHFLIEAFGEFAKTHTTAQLRIVGTGDMEQRLRDQAAALPCNDRITFVGAVTHDVIASEYQQADIFALPSLNEGMSNSLLEAMASGLAIVTTDTGGTSELVDATNGIIVPQRSTDELVTAFTALSKDPERLRTMQSNSRDRAMQMSWSAVAQSTMNLYTEHFS